MCACIKDQAANYPHKAEYNTLSANCNRFILWMFHKCLKKKKGFSLQDWDGPQELLMPGMPGAPDGGAYFCGDFNETQRVSTERHKYIE